MGDTAADIQRRRVDKEQRAKDEAEKQQMEEKEREEPRSSEDTHKEDLLQTERHWLEKDEVLTGVKVKWTQRMGERPAQKLLSVNPHKKEHMTNIYETDSVEEAKVDFDKDHQKLYDKTHDKFKDKARKNCLLKDLQAATSARLGSNHTG